MGIVRRRQAYAIALVFFASVGAEITNAELWNLSADWSDTFNPNGAWSYRVGTDLGITGTRIEGVSYPFDPPGAPSIWTDHTNYVGWSKSIGTEGFPFETGELQAGDVYGLPNSTGSIQIWWENPLYEAITVDVSGRVWAIRDNGRASDWLLTLDGDTVANGTVGDSSQWSRSYLIDLTLDVAPGQVVAFIASMSPQSYMIDYLALDLTIEPAVVPVPGAFLLGILGMGVAGVKLRKHA